MKIFEIADDLILKTAGKICDDDVKVIVPECREKIFPTISFNENIINIKAVNKDGETQEESITLPVENTLPYLITPGEEDIFLPANKYYNGTYTLAGEENLISTNIKKDESIYDIRGNYEGEPVTVFNAENTFLTESSIIFPTNPFGSEITTNAFLNCYDIENITLPLGVDYSRICSSAFANLKSIRSINNLVFKNRVTIGSHAFLNCYNLSFPELNLSNASIGDAAFCNCSNIASIITLRNISSIGNAAFKGCITTHTLNLFNFSSSLADVPAAFAGMRCLKSIYTDMSTFNNLTFFSSTYNRAYLEIFDDTPILNLPVDNNSYGSIYLPRSNVVTLLSNYCVGTMGLFCHLFDRLATTELSIIKINKEAQIQKQGNFVSNTQCLLKGYHNLSLSNFTITTTSSSLQNLSVSKVDENGFIWINGVSTLNEGETATIQLQYNEGNNTVSSTISLTARILEITIALDSLDHNGNSTKFIEVLENCFSAIKDGFVIKETPDGKRWYTTPSDVKYHGEKLYGRLIINTNRKVSIQFKAVCFGDNASYSDGVEIFNANDTTISTTAYSVHTFRTSKEVPIGSDNFILLMIKDNGYKPTSPGDYRGINGITTGLTPAYYIKLEDIIVLE